MIRIAIAAALALAVTLPAAPAQATLLTRTFVSSAGLDTNPCTITAPCATFAVAYATTAPNGIVAALDPGKYGPLTIMGPVTINGNGWAAITGPSANTAITINAGSTDSVTLSGLAIDGAGAASNGIVLNSAGSLTVTDCVVQNFVGNSNTTGNGILIQPTAGTLNFAISNTTVASNAVGIQYTSAGGTPTANGVIDHVTSINARSGGSGIGISVDSNGTGGGTIALAITNSIVSNDGAGIAIANADSPLAIQASIDNVTASNNAEGIVVNGTSNVVLGRSVVTGNIVFGILNNTSPNTFYSFGNNQIGLNGSDGALNSIALK